MHESAIANQILEEAKKRSKGKKIKAITIEVGDRAHLTANELKEFMSTMVEYEIKVLPKRANVKCECGYEGEPKILSHQHDMTIFECPKCGKTPAVLDGDDIVLKEIVTN